MQLGRVLISGVGPHSLGEALVRRLLRSGLVTDIIGIDRLPNTDLEGIPNYKHIVLDLNPLLTRSTPCELEINITRALRQAARGTINYLLHCAGVYDSGYFIDYDVERRFRTLGLNILGTVELLHATMSCSADRRAFGFLLVGSFQGLHARPQRSIYAPSKAFGLDFCTSLAAEKQFAHCDYIAAGPIDTAMLHHNHWINKANGSPEFFERLFCGPSSEYTAVFVECDHKTFQKVVARDFPGQRAILKAAMKRYKRVRSKISDGGLGILSVAACAEAITGIISRGRRSPGAYLVSANPRAPVASIRRADFLSLSRRRLFERVSKPFKH